MSHIFQFSINDVADDSSKGFTITPELSIFAVKKDGLLYVYHNRCPHLGIELEWQEDQFLDSENALIQCCTHGALFIIDSGECVAGPCVGDSLQALPFTMDGNTVNVDIALLQA